ncbi:xylitol dehydrogenase [Orobanche hederae]
MTLEIHAELLKLRQGPKKHQLYVASVLGFPMLKVVCRVKRVGGGFGGKATR